MIELLSSLPIEFAKPIWLLGIAGFMLIVALSFFFKSQTKWYAKIYIFVIYLLLATAIFGSLAQPQLETQTSAQQVGTLLVMIDNSSSMQLHDLKLNIPQKHQTQIIAQGDQSPLVSKITSSMPKEGTILLISDGFATDSDTLLEIVAKAKALNTTIHTVDLKQGLADASVVINGPDKTFVGASNQYEIKIGGNTKLVGTLRVILDDEVVLETQELDQPHFVEKTFFDQKTHTVEARLDVQDELEINDKYFKTTRVLPKPKVAYLGNNARLEVFLKQIFEVTKITQTKDLDPYSGVVISNTPAEQIDGYELEDYISNGNGLAVFGGNKAYDFGKYDASTLSSILPVKNGIAGPRNKAVIIVVIDISASTDQQFSSTSQFTGLEVQKAIAYDFVKQLSDDNVVGIVAFNTEAFEVSGLTPVKDSRNTLLNKISRIQMQGNTRINVGLGAAYQMLKDHVGGASVVIITDGIVGGGGDGTKTWEQVQRLKERNVQIHPVAVGSNADVSRLRQMAIETKGTFVVPSETDRLLLNFGKASEQTQIQSSFTFLIENARHPITSGLEPLSTELNNMNQVVPKTGAQVLVAANSGDPALTIWQYGVGRVAAWTAFEGNEELRTFLNDDSLLTYRMLSWIAGDPERNNPPLLAIDDTDTQTPATVHAQGASIAELATNLNTTTEEMKFLNLEKIDETEFSGNVEQTVTGFTTYFGATFATNYPQEYEQIGQSEAMKLVASQTGGQFIPIEEIADVTINVKNPEKTVQTLEDITKWVIISAIALLLIHIFIKKMWERKNE